MSRRLYQLSILGALGLALAISDPAFANLSCTATVSDIAFGGITVRDGVTEQTMANVNFGCTGGTPNAGISACLALGAGTGGAAGGNALRYMRRSDNARLDYSLTSDSYTGSPWNSVETTAQLDGAGTGNFSTTIFAQVILNGATDRAGNYSSGFLGSDVSFSFGEGACVTTGASPSFNVSANVVPSCTLNVSALNFGSLRSLGQNADASATISADCTLETAYSISLDHGLNGTGATRRMRQGADYISYSLYQDSGRSQPWGDQVTDDFDGAGTGAAQNITVYGRIPPQTTPAPGTYNDTVVVTITY